MDRSFFLQLRLAVARVLIAAGLLWLCFTASQLVMLRGEWLRDVWYGAGLAAMLAGLLLHPHALRRSTAVPHGSVSAPFVRASTPSKAA